MPENPLGVDFEMSENTLKLLGTLLTGDYSQIQHMLENDPELETKLIQTYITNFTDALSPGG